MPIRTNPRCRGGPNYRGPNHHHVNPAGPQSSGGASQAENNYLNYLREDNHHMSIQIQQLIAEKQQSSHEMVRSQARIQHLEEILLELDKQKKEVQTQKEELEQQREVLEQQKQSNTVNNDLQEEVRLTTNKDQENEDLKMQVEKITENKNLQEENNKLQKESQALLEESQRLDEKIMLNENVIRFKTDQFETLLTQFQELLTSEKEKEDLQEENNKLQKENQVLFEKTIESFESLLAIIRLNTDRIETLQTEKSQLEKVLFQELLRSKEQIEDLEDLYIREKKRCCKFFRGPKGRKNNKKISEEVIEDTTEQKREKKAKSRRKGFWSWLKCCFP